MKQSPAKEGHARLSNLNDGKRGRSRIIFLGGRKGELEISSGR
jgi:hypothetical protein